VVDAFTIPSWNQSVCQCCLSHRETCFIFPPVGVEQATMKKARSDGARCAFVVPTAYKTGYWMALRNHSIYRAALTRPDLDLLLRQNNWELSIDLSRSKLQQDDGTVRIMDGRARERGGRRFHHPFLESVSVPVLPQSSRDLLHLSTSRT
jgi:hypothetical protein